LLKDAESGCHAIFLASVVLFEWCDDDRATRRLVVAQVVNARLATRVEVARVFGLHVNTVSRIAQQVAAQGVTASIWRKRGPHGPFKVTPAVVAELRCAVENGLTERAAQRQLEQHLKIRLSQPQVHRVMYRLKREVAEQPALALLTDGISEEEVAGVAVAAEPESDVLPSQELSNQLEEPSEEHAAVLLAAGQSLASRYLGLMLFYPALEVVGLLELAAQVYQLPGMVRFGVQQVFTELFCLALLQEPSVERVKHIVRNDLGAVMGSGRAACVKTLRRKLDELSQQRQAVQLGMLLARHWLDVGLVNASYLYVDGHVKIYNGSRLVPEVWDSHRRMPMPGIVQYFVNDLRGCPLLVVTEEVRGNLAKSLPSVIAAVRNVLGDQRFVVIFDRGGYDGQLFKWLVEQGLDFITYQRGEVRLADHLFARREVRWDGQRVRFHIAEDTISVGESGPWRRVVIRTPGHQRPILTSLDANGMAAGRVAALMLTRWRQENFFKYARAHLGLDVLTTYAAETAVDHEVPNPTVRAAKAELKCLRTTAQKLRAALGRAVVLDTGQPPTAGRPSSKAKRTPHLAPTTRAALISQLQTLEVQIEATRSQLRGLPAHVPLSSLGPLPQVPRLERKLITDVVRMATYNAQSWLVDRLARHYTNANDVHDLLRSFAQLSGTLIRQSDGGLRVRLDPPDLPIHRRALAGLCTDLNLGQPVFPASDHRLHYEVADRPSKEV
jgi:hypothetical protein